jgi:hypothetical protein
VLLNPHTDAQPWVTPLLEGKASGIFHLVASDVTPVPQPDRLRGVLTLYGRLELDAHAPCEPVRRHLLLEPDEAAVRFVPYSVALSWRVGPSIVEARRTNEVPLASYRSASHDPLADWEGGWLAHLDRDHDRQMRDLVASRYALTDVDLVHPIGVDANGFVMRVYALADVTDVWIPFSRPVGSPEEAVAGFQELLTTERPVRRA